MKNLYPKVAVIVINWNNYTDTCECVESVLKSDYPNYEIFLVDNASKDDSSVKLKERFPQATFIQNKENLGFTGGNNIAIKRASNGGFDYFWLLNNDTVIENTCITLLIEEAQKNESVGLLSPLLYNYPNKLEFQHAGSYLDWNELIIRNFDNPEEYLKNQNKHKVCLWGTALLIKKSVIDSIGYLDEKFFAYDEDLDYCLRAIKAGFECKIVVNTKVYHKHNFDEKPKMDFKDYYFFYMARNGFWIFKDYAKGLYRMFVFPRYISKMIQTAGCYKEDDYNEAADATIDGLYHACRNFGGIWDRNVKCPKLIKKIIMNHPFLTANLINLRFDLIFSNIFRRVKQI